MTIDTTWVLTKLYAAYCGLCAGMNMAPLPYDEWAQRQEAQCC